MKNLFFFDTNKNSYVLIKIGLDMIVPVIEGWIL